MSDYLIENLLGLVSLVSFKKRRKFMCQSGKGLILFLVSVSVSWGHSESYGSYCEAVCQLGLLYLCRVTNHFGQNSDILVTSLGTPCAQI